MTAKLSPGVNDAGLSPGQTDFRHARDADEVGEPQHLFDAVQLLHVGVLRLSTKRLSAPLTAGPSTSASPACVPAGDQREESRPVAALGGDGEIVALPQLRHQLHALGDARPRRHGDDVVDVRIAGEDAVGALEHQHVDVGVGPGAAQAADQRRGEQQVADAAQAHHQDARPRRQRQGRASALVPLSAAGTPLFCSSTAAAGENRAISGLLAEFPAASTACLQAVLGRASKARPCVPHPVPPR